jgi:hypothetical protein
MLSRVGALVGEELVDQSLPRDDAIRAQEEERQHPTLLRPAGVDGIPVHANQEWAEDAELEARRSHPSDASVDPRSAAGKERGAL